MLEEEREGERRGVKERGRERILAEREMETQGNGADPKSLLFLFLFSKRYFLFFWVGFHSARARSSFEASGNWVTWLPRLVAMILSFVFHALTTLGPLPNEI